MNRSSGTESRLGETRRYEPTGYHMIRNIEISNFRGIDHLRLHDLGRVNVLVGPNGSGKTAFLEAIYLAGGNSPENLIKTKQWRGRELTELSGELKMVQDALWADTFRDPNVGEASIQIVDDNNAIRSVFIRRIEPARVFDAAGVSNLAHVGMHFLWEGPEGKAEVVPTFTPSGIQVPAVFPGPGVHLLSARMNISESETARTFSRLTLEGDPSAFLSAFVREFPWLSEVDVQAPAGPPALYARMNNGRKLPLTMISGGISHLAAIMVRLAANKRAVMLIDEIENGFYYDHYESIWRTVFELAELSDSQIFASTHSVECLKALSTALADRADQVRFIRSRREDGEVRFQQMSGQGLFKALKIGEVR
jgi:ABC-type branched-subunit amino acid transport system ATPase component